LLSGKKIIYNTIVSVPQSTSDKSNDKDREKCGGSRQEEKAVPDES
jgi:hypothetical protein